MDAINSLMLMYVQIWKGQKEKLWFMGKVINIKDLRNYIIAKEKKNHNKIDTQKVDFIASKFISLSLRLKMSHQINNY